MCGIAGFCNLSKDWHKNIVKMNSRMSHRGPDADGYWTCEDHTVVLGHTRLSIIDLSKAGSQPMISHNQRYVIVLNGEIYNHIELKQKLMNEKGINFFKGHSDTEVLIEYISEYGFEEALEASIGMFAVGVFDRQKKKLYLGRDRIGEKPLYFGFIDKGFVFASELGSIQEIAEQKVELNYDALTIYFKYGYIPAPYTIYKEIFKAEAGSIIEIEEPYQDLKQYKYWDIMKIARCGQEKPFEGTRKEAADRLEELLKDSIRLQMSADVPVGAFLSGGIDSSTVVAIAQELAIDKVKTFSIGFENEEYNEAVYAKEIAEYLGTEHTELYVKEDDVVGVIPKIPYIYSEPFADSSQLPTYLVSCLAKGKVTVSLSGDGGDELFGGYNSYFHVINTWNKIKNIPLPLRKAVGISMRGIKTGTKSQMGLIKHYIDSCSPEELYSRTGDAGININNLVLGGGVPIYKYSEYQSGYLKNSEMENLMLMDMLMYHPDDILVKVDRSAMAVSLESRVPLLDKNIVEFAWSLPLSYKTDCSTRKKVLRDVLYRYIPEKMMERPKKGFSIPIAQWIKNGRLSEWAQDMLSTERIRKQNILNPIIVEKIWKNFKNNNVGAGQIWYLLIFEEWMERVGKGAFSNIRNNVQEL